MVLLSPTPKPLYARSGDAIPCLASPLVETEAKVANRANSIMTEMLPGKLVLRSISAYACNCVGMIFACRRAWIDIEHIYDILRNDGYRQIRQHECVIGDVVVYRDNVEPTHVALITQVQFSSQTSQFPLIRVLSKWGADAEFEHRMHDVTSNLGKPVEFYTERPLWKAQ